MDIDTRKVAGDLLLEFDLITSLDPNLHIQLKALEDEYSLEHGYKNMAKILEKREKEGFKEGRFIDG